MMNQTTNQNMIDQFYRTSGPGGFGQSRIGFFKKEASSEESKGSEDDEEEEEEEEEKC